MCGVSMGCLFGQTSDGRSGRRRPSSQLHGSNKWIFKWKEIILLSIWKQRCVALCGKEKGAQCVFLDYYYNPSSSVESRGGLRKRPNCRKFRFFSPQICLLLMTFSSIKAKNNMLH